MNNIYIHLFDMLEQGKQIILATVIGAEGSTPQVTGASALFSHKELLKGTIGGGVIEAAVQKNIFTTLEQKISYISAFKLDNDTDSEEGAVCGGKMKVLVDACPEKNKKAFQELYNSLINKKGGILGAWIEDLPEGGVSVSRFWIEGGKKVPAEGKKIFSFFQINKGKLFSRGKPALYQGERKTGQKKGCLYLEPVFPAAQLVIAGAGHIGCALSHLGNLLNFEITVIDDRPEYANKIKLPAADRIIVSDIGKAVKNYLITPDTYLVIVTRGHQHDAAVLRACIGSEAAYIGMIGSAEKVKFVRHKFLEKGWATEEQLARVHAPIGLPIGSKTVEEIAVSIAAQLVKVRSQISPKR